MSVFKTGAQELKINKIKNGYQLETDNKETDDRIYDTLFFLGVKKDSYIKFDSLINPRPGIYVGVFNWKKKYYSKYDWFLERYSVVNYRIPIPVFKGASYDVFTTSGKIINTKGAATDVLVTADFHPGVFYSVADTASGMPEKICRKDSLANYSHLIMEINNHYEAYDFTGKMLLSKPAGKIMRCECYPWSYWYSINGKWGLVNAYNNQVIQPKSDTILKKEISILTTNDNPNRRNYKYIDNAGDIDGGFDLNQGMVDGVYYKYTNDLFLGVDHVQLKDTLRKINFLASRDSGWVDSTVISKEKIFKSGNISLYNDKFESITQHPIDGIVSVNLIDDGWYNRSFLVKENILNTYVSTFGSTAKALMVLRQKKFGLINRYLKQVLPCEFDDFVLFHTNNQNYTAMKKSGKWQVFTLDGTVVSSINYDSVWFYHRPDSNYSTIKRLRFSNEFAFVSQNSKTGVISLKDGAVIVPAEFDFIWFDPLQGVFVVNNGAKEKAIVVDSVFEYKIDLQTAKYQMENTFVNYKMKIPLGGKFGLYSMDGKQILKPAYAFVLPEKEKNVIYSTIKIKPNKVFHSPESNYFFNPNNDFLTYFSLLKIVKGKQEK